MSYRPFADVGLTASFSSISYTVSQALMPPRMVCDPLPCGCIVARPESGAPAHVCPAHPQLKLPLDSL